MADTANSGEAPMPSTVPVEVNCTWRVPAYRTQHETMAFIRSCQRQKAMKRCAHLSVAEVRSDSTADYAPIFGPSCKKHSLRAEDVDGKYVQGRHAGEIVTVFYGCPEGCHFYRSAWRGKALELGRAGKVFLGAPFHWYDRQPTSVKLLVAGVLVAMIVSYRGPEFLKNFAAIMSVIRGQ